MNYSQPPWQLKQCLSCGMVYLQNALTYQALEEDYAWEGTFAEESTARRRKHPLLHFLGRIPKRLVQSVTGRDKLLSLAKDYFDPGAVLDVGCAGGHTLINFPDTYIPYGIEISHELSQIAASAFSSRGGTVIQSDAMEGLRQMPRAAFTGIIMTSFLEHELHPKQILDSARRLLKHQGKVIIKVPNFSSWNRVILGKSWSGFRFPDHVNYFDPEHMGKMLSEEGYRIVRFGFSDRLPTSDSMWLVAGTT